MNADRAAAELVAWVAARGLRDAAAVPRDVESIARAIAPVAIERVRDLTAAKAAAILRERHRANVDASDEPVGGYLFVGGGRAIIFVESRFGENYERFGIAHEIGHLWLEHMRVDCAGLVRVRCEGPRDRAADTFAAALLMPRDEVRAIVEGATVWDALASMRERFRVSERAASRRLRELTRG